MSTDYNLPEWFWDDDVTDLERSNWFAQERCRRQAMRQDTAFMIAFRKYLDRLERKQKARSDTVDLRDMR